MRNKLKINNPLKLMYEICRASMEGVVYSCLFIGLIIVYIDNWEHSSMKKLCNPEVLHHLVVIAIIVSLIFMVTFSVYKFYFYSEINAYEVRSKIITLIFYLILFKSLRYSEILHIVILLYFSSFCVKFVINMYWQNKQLSYEM